MKTIMCLFNLLLALILPAKAGLYSYNTATVIPDNNTLGTGDTLQLTVSGENSSLSGLTLTFGLQGGYSGDLSGYLRLGSGTSSPYYNLTSLIQGQSLSSGTPTTYSINFTDSGFSGAFNGVNPNGTWTLFFADTSAGDQTTMNSWSLDVTAVPEPVNATLGIFGILLVAGAAGKCYRKAAHRS